MEGAPYYIIRDSCNRTYSCYSFLRGRQQQDGGVRDMEHIVAIAFITAIGATGG